MQDKELKDKLSAFDGIFKKVGLRADYKDAFEIAKIVYKELCTKNAHSLIELISKGKAACYVCKSIELKCKEKNINVGEYKKYVVTGIVLSELNLLPNYEQTGNKTTYSGYAKHLFNNVRDMLKYNKSD